MFLLTVAGYFWSEDSATALHQIYKQLNWLILPAVVGLSFYRPRLRTYVFIALSLGLLVHLLVCTAQYLQWVTIIGQGSNADDPAGFIGHLSFGFIYAIWIGALIVVAQKQSWKWRIVCYVLALYALVSVFLTQGRSGYILVLIIGLLLLWKVFFQHCWRVKLMLFCVIFGGALMLIYTPMVQKQIAETQRGIEAFQQGKWSLVEPRIKVWLTGVEVYRQHPWLGVGTGDYLLASTEVVQQKEFKHLQVGGDNFSHPHNAFLFSLTRWGPLGLLAFVYLCWAWLRTGWKKDWQHDTMNAYLCTSSALMVIVHGLTEVSLTGKLTLVFAILMLAFSMMKTVNQSEMMPAEK